jgi:hypothetical protein
MHLRQAHQACDLGYQLALARPGRSKLSDRDKEEVRRCTLDPDRLKWPRQRAGS